MDAGRHPKIELLTYSEIEDISGYIGNFHVKVRKRTRYVNEAECTACGDCVKVCPVVKPDEQTLGLGVRKAIHIPFPQAVPPSYLINMEDCLGDVPIACGKCLDVCQKGCIDYDMKDEIVEFDVGAIVVATGMDVYDPTELDEYGYRRFPDVVTSMEFEVLSSPGGPTGGKVIRFTDRKKPKTIGFVQCVGSRSLTKGNPHCSNICCMNTVKDTLYLAEHYPEITSKVYYMDMRAFGKGFEDLYRRSKEKGVQYIRGMPGEVSRTDSGALKFRVEDTNTGEIRDEEVDMLVLSVGLIPRRDNDLLKNVLTMSVTPDGFFAESHPKLKPVDSPTDGVFLAGCAEYPKDVKDSVTQASGAAARAENILSKSRIKIEAITARIDAEACKYCGTCEKVCPYHAISGSDKKAGKAPKLQEALCKGCGTCCAECTFGAIDMRHFADRELEAQVDALLAEDPMDKVLVFACNWCSYAGADLAGLSRLSQPSNARLVRTMCSGRVDEKFVLQAFEAGAPVVLVSGCHFADCHYIDANRYTQKRVYKLWNKLERLGIRPERLQLEWCSAAEAARWVEIMEAMEELRKQVTPEEIDETIRLLGEDRERRAKARTK